MSRPLAHRLLFALLGLVALSAAAVAQTAGLRDNVVIDTDVVRLGDIFTAVPESLRDTVVTYAPQPGKRSILDYRWLSALAKRYNLPWRPRSRYDRVVIERASQIIDAETIAIEIRDALLAEGIDGPVQVELASRTFQIHLALDTPPYLEIRDLQVNTQSRRFVAVVLAGQADRQRSYKIGGRYFPVRDVPVLVRDLQRGEVIRPEDVVLRPVRLDRQRRQSYTSRDAVIGLAARRLIRAGTPLGARDLQIPVLVARNSVVTITLTTANMTLRAVGKALDNGGLGETIRVLNTDSRRTIEAVVTGPGQVAVYGPAGP